MADKESRKPGIELDAIDLASLTFVKTGPKQAGQEEKIVPSTESKPKSLKPEEVPSKEKSLPLLPKRRGWFLGGFILLILFVCTGLFWFLDPLEFLSTDGKRLSSDVRRATRAFTENTEKLSVSISDVEEKAKEINSKTKITQILTVISLVNAQLPEYEYWRNEYIRSVHDDQSQLAEAGYIDLVAAATFLQHDTSLQYIEILKQYMYSLERYLAYFYINYDEVKQRRQPQIESYEELYLEYKRILNKYEQVVALEKQAIERLLETYPQARGLFLYRRDLVQKME